MPGGCAAVTADNDLMGLGDVSPTSVFAGFPGGGESAKMSLLYKEALLAGGCCNISKKHFLRLTMLNLRWKVVIIEVEGANNIMEFRVLKYFLMVSIEENFTKAAALLHVTQP